MLYMYLLQYNIYIIIVPTCFDCSESSSDINFQELLLYIVLQYFTSYSNYSNRDPIMHYRIRANVSCPPQQLIDNSSVSVMHKVISIVIVLV